MAKRERKSHQPSAAVNCFLNEYNPVNLEDLNECMGKFYGSLLETMLGGEMDYHLGFKNNDHGPKDTTDRRNGYIRKVVHTSYGDIEIDSPRDRDATFTPELIPKRCRDISGVEDYILELFSQGQSDREIADNIEKIYGFSMSHEKVSAITNRVMEAMEEWRSRPLKECYPFVYVDCIYIKIRKDYSASKAAVYTILGYDMEGHKELLGLWISESESKTFWTQIFDELKQRGVQDIGIMCMDGVCGLTEGAKTIFPNIETQRCMVHLIRNSIVVIPRKSYKEFTADLRCIYAAPSLDIARNELEKFKAKWSDYPRAVRVWVDNFAEVEKLFEYTSLIRSMVYTTNPIESVYSSFRRVVKSGLFPNESSVYKLFYMQAMNLQKKWDASNGVRGWAEVLNQFETNPTLKRLLDKYGPGK